MLQPEDPMDHDPDAPIGELIGRVIGDGRELAEAEFNLLKAKAVFSIKEFRAAFMLIVLAAAFAFAAIVTLSLTLADTLAAMIGPLAGGAIATVVTLLVAWLISKAALSELEKRQ